MSGMDWRAPGWVPATADVRAAVGRSGSRRTTVEGFDAWLAEHEAKIVQHALATLAEAFDIDVTGVQKIMDDGYPSFFMNTPEQAREMVKDWLMARAEEG